LSAESNTADDDRVPLAESSSSVWLQSPERQAVFVCCGSCSNCSDEEQLEAKIVAKVSEPEPAAAA
jgi:hypothetical protein